jgi:hypothetical protein
MYVLIAYGHFFGIVASEGCTWQRASYLGLMQILLGQFYVCDVERKNDPEITALLKSGHTFVLFRRVSIHFYFNLSVRELT